MRLNFIKFSKSTYHKILVGKNILLGLGLWYLHDCAVQPVLDNTTVHTPSFRDS